MATKFGTKWAITLFLWDILLMSLFIFSSLFVKFVILSVCLSVCLFVYLTVCFCLSLYVWHVVLLWLVNKHKHICKIFASIWAVSRLRYKCCQPNFTPTNPCCYGNEIWDRMGVFARNMSRIFSCSCSSSNTVVLVVVVRSAFSVRGVYTVFHKKDHFLFFSIIHSNDVQFTQNLYQL